jgi:hypothetical protein
VQLLQQLNDWFDAFVRCLSLPMSGPACRPLWETVMYASAAFGLALTLWATWKIVSTMRAQATAQREEEARKRIAEAQRAGDEQEIAERDIAAEVTDPKLAETIRRELERQRRRKLRKPETDDD